MEITFEDDENAVSPESEMSLVYNGQKYIGRGNDYLWMDTLADLETKLPKDVEVACCMACRNGNTCPFGNEANQIFCTKDLKISCKEDMCDMFVTDTAYDRCVKSFDYCEDFVRQNDRFFTYSDYYYFHRRKM